MLRIACYQQSFANVDPDVLRLPVDSVERVLREFLPRVVSDAPPAVTSWVAGHLPDRARHAVDSRGVEPQRTGRRAGSEKGDGPDPEVVPWKQAKQSGASSRQMLGCRPRGLGRKAKAAPTRQTGPVRWARWAAVVASGMTKAEAARQVGVSRAAVTIGIGKLTSGRR